MKNQKRKEIYISIITIAAAIAVDLVYFFIVTG